MQPAVPNLEQIDAALSSPPSVNGSSEDVMSTYITSRTAVTDVSLVSSQRMALFAMGSPPACNLLQQNFKFLVKF